MNTAAWFEIGAVTAYAFVLLWISRWPISDELTEDDAVERLSAYDGWDKPIPGRENCPLTLDEEERFVEIVDGWRR